MRLGLAALLLLVAVSHAWADSIGKEIANFTLKDVDGKRVSLDDAGGSKATVVLFLGTECPINNAYGPRLGELHEEYAGKGVRFLGINSNHHDNVKAIAAHARKHKLPFPVLRDEGQVVADHFGAQRVPEAFILDAERVVRYQGRIDDQFGIGFVKPKPSRRDLAEALDDLLAGKEVRAKTTAVAGCYITRAARPKEGGEITFSRHVAPVIERRCVGCHRPGQIGPMPLLTYDDVSSWSAMIREVVTEKRMPPWHADPAHGVFGNDRSLSKDERDTLLTWIAQGCPKGEEREPLAAGKPDGWSIGTPDAVFTMTRAFDVPAKAPKSGIKYQYFTVPTNFKEDMWIQAAQAQPGSRAVVHHIIVYISTGGKRSGEDGIGNGFLVAYVPGDAGVRFPPGMAKKIPKGATLAFQMHYTPNGVAQSDRSCVGLVFAKEPPKFEMKTRAIAQQLLFIPPGRDNYKADSRSTFKKEALVYSLFPHMHLRGKDFEYRVVYPDGKTEKILSVPKYDFNWQDSYVFKEPLRLPAGSRIECTAHFDNSKGNPSNPDPTSWVRWGDQTWEEMMIGFVDYAYVERVSGE